MSVLRALRTLPLAALIATATACSGSNSPSHTPSSIGSQSAKSVFIRPGGHGNCLVTSPCGDLATALRKATNGGLIQAESGTYPSQLIPRSSTYDARTDLVTIRPATGAHPFFGNIRSSASHVQFEDLSIKGVFYLTREANHTVVERDHLFGGKATLVIRASHVLVNKTLIEGGRALDGINVASHPRNTDIVLRNNTVRDFSGDTVSGQQHPDCIQLFDTSHVTIESNSLYDCYNSAITFSPGARLGIDHVLIEGNFLQGCLPERQRCGNGGSVMDLRVPALDTTVAHNTFGAGSLRLPANPGVTAVANIIGYLSTATCQTAVAHSLLLAYTTFPCPKGQVPGAEAGNWVADVKFRDARDNDLSLVLPAPPNPVTGASGIPAGQGKYGQMPAGTVGASQ